MSHLDDVIGSERPVSPESLSVRPSLVVQAGVPYQEGPCGQQAELLPLPLHRVSLDD